MYFRIQLQQQMQKMNESHNNQIEPSNSPPNEDSIYENLQDDSFSCSYFDVSYVEEDKAQKKSQIFLLKGEEILGNMNFRVLLIPDNKPSEPECELYVTNFRLLFNSHPSNSLHSKNQFSRYLQEKEMEKYVPLSIPFGYIKQLDQERDIKILLKTGLKYCIRPSVDTSQVFQVIMAGMTRLPFCNQFTLEKQTSQMYDCLAELQRMKINQDQFTIVGNQRGKLCASYPKFIIIAKNVNAALLEQTLKSRIDSKIPALTYYDNASGGTIWRSSKLKLGFESSKYNSAYLQAISKNLIVIEAKIEDNGKQIGSKFENNGSLRLIHQKMMLSFSKGEHFIKNASKWYEDVGKLLANAYICAINIIKGNSVLIQGTTGVDRVCQISALSQIIIDPFYRTIRGFGLLIEKQFVAFGHPFNQRLGFQRQKIQEMSPIFIQFLECVHQLLSCHPYSFQFSGAYLARIAYELLTTRYNDFLFNSFQQKYGSKMIGITPTIWKNLPMLKEYYNYQWKEEVAVIGLLILRQKPSVKQFLIWREYFDLCTSMRAQFSEKLSNTAYIKKEIYKKLHRLNST